jgi:hypothetical protein
MKSLLLILSFTATTSLCIPTLIATPKLPLYLLMTNFRVGDCSVLTEKEVKKVFKKNKIEIIDKEQAMLLFKESFREHMEPYLDYSKGGYTYKPGSTHEMQSVPSIAKKIEATFYYSNNVLDSIFISSVLYPNSEKQIPTTRTFNNSSKVDKVVFLQNTIDSCNSLKLFEWN